MTQKKKKFITYLFMFLLLISILGIIHVAHHIICNDGDWTHYFAIACFVWSSFTSINGIKDLK